MLKIIFRSGRTYCQLRAIKILNITENCSSGFVSNWWHDRNFAGHKILQCCIRVQRVRRIYNLKMKSCPKCILRQLKSKSYSNELDTCSEWFPMVCVLIYWFLLPNYQLQTCLATDMVANKYNKTLNHAQAFLNSQRGIKDEDKLQIWLFLIITASFTKISFYLFLGAVSKWWCTL